MPKTSSIRPVVSMQCRLVTDRRTHDDSIYRASIRLRSKRTLFTARCYASAVLAMGVSVCPCLSQVGVLSKPLIESSMLLACELPSTRPTLC